MNSSDALCRIVLASFFIAFFIRFLASRGLSGRRLKRNQFVLSALVNDFSVIEADIVEDWALRVQEINANYHGVAIAIHHTVSGVMVNSPRLAVSLGVGKFLLALLL